MRWWTVLPRTMAIAAVATIGPVFAQSGGSHDGHMGEMVSPDQVKWQKIPREWTNGPPPPPGVSAPAEVAIIWGDPTKEGAPFMFRLRSSLKGTIVPVPPHSHPTDERITVLSGVFCLGMGDNYDPSSCRDMPAGSYMIMPAGMHHFAVAKDSVIEVYGTGPFKINWVRKPS